MATWTWADRVKIGSSGQQILSGAGSPEGVVTANVGDVYFRVDGGSTQTIYVKSTGSGNTGWSLLNQGSGGGVPANIVASTISLDNGADGTPSYTFTSDPTVGFFYDGTSVILSVGGEQVATFSPGSITIQDNNDTDITMNAGDGSLHLDSSGILHIGADAGVLVGAATPGGAKGSSTINAAAFYKNGVEITGGGGGSALNFLNIHDIGASGVGKNAVGGALAASGVDLTINSSGPSLNVFAVGDVGKVLMIAGAGTAGADLWTTIATYVSPTHVTTNDAGVVSVTNAEVYWGMTDDTTTLSDAISSMTAPTIIYCPAGVYMYSIPNAAAFLYGNGINGLTVADASGGNTVYTPYIPFGPNYLGSVNSLVGRKFTIWNSAIPANNGTFTCVASDPIAGTITLNNPSGASESFGPGFLQQVNYLVGIVGDGSNSTIWLANNPNSFAPGGFFAGCSNYPWIFSKFRVRGPGVFSVSYLWEMLLIGSGDVFDLYVGNTQATVAAMDFDGALSPSALPYGSRWAVRQCTFTTGTAASYGGSVTFGRAQSNQDKVSLHVSGCYAEYGFNSENFENIIFDNCLAGSLTAVINAGFQITGQHPTIDTGEVSLRNCYVFGQVSDAGFNSDTGCRITYNNCYTSASPGPGDAVYGFYLSGFNIVMENCYIKNANLGVFIAETSSLTVSSNVLLMNVRADNLVDFDASLFPVVGFSVALTPDAVLGGQTFINCVCGQLPSALDIAFTSDTSTPLVLVGCFVDPGGSENVDVVGQGGIITVVGGGFPAGVSGSVVIVGGGVTVNPQVVSYQAGSGDANNLVTISSGSANNFTIPDNATTPFPVGTTLSVIQLGSGQTTINPLNGSVNINTPSSLTARAQFSTVSVVKIQSDTWVAGGDLT